MLGRFLGAFVGAYLGAAGDAPPAEAREAFVDSVLEAVEDEPSIVTIGGEGSILAVVDEEGTTMAFKIKAGATHRVLRRQVRHNGRAVDLTGATVLLRLKPPTGAIVERAVVVEAGTEGWVQYELVAEDTAAGAGTYKGELVVTYGVGDVEVAPSGGYFEIVVTARLAA